ncbi:unnamed protein product [Ilex paraguariensis]|uniref:Uncharacterized protein n=1 Tax=Ilex paraguariensis TaxID=185542 RepID=A0ABC8SHD3_9AQUA
MAKWSVLPCLRIRSYELVALIKVRARRLVIGLAWVKHSDGLKCPYKDNVVAGKGGK